MTVRLGDVAPNFTAQTTEGVIDFYEWKGTNWAVLFSHPKDFTPVCTTELGTMAKMKSEFDKRNTKIIGLSVDPVGNHEKWAKDIAETQGAAPNYPLIGDSELVVAKLYDMLPEDAGTTSEGRTAANNATVRTVFVIGPDKKIKLMLIYPMTTGHMLPKLRSVLPPSALRERRINPQSARSSSHLSDGRRHRANRANQAMRRSRRRSRRSDPRRSRSSG